MGNKFIRNVHLVGMTTLALAIVANFIPVAYLAISYDIIPTVNEIFGIWAVVAASYGFNWVIQPPSFFPVLGLVGTYVSFLSGSLGDVRLPVITAAQKLTKLEAGTPQGDAIASIAVTTSVFATFILLTVFVFIGNEIVGLFSPFVTHAFTYIVPAIFSAVFVNMAVSKLKLSIPIFLISAIVTSVISNAFSNIIGIVLGIAFARVLYMYESKKKASKENVEDSSQSQ